MAAWHLSLFSFSYRFAAQNKSPPPPKKPNKNKDKSLLCDIENFSLHKIYKSSLPFCVPWKKVMLSYFYVTLLQVASLMGRNNLIDEMTTIPVSRDQTQWCQCAVFIHNSSYDPVFHQDTAVSLQRYTPISLGKFTRPFSIPLLLTTIAGNFMRKAGYTVVDSLPAKANSTQESRSRNLNAELSSLRPPILYLKKITIVGKF